MLGIKKVAIIGLGYFGSSLCERLWESGVEVIAIDQSESRVRAVEPYCTHPVIANTKEREALLDLGLDMMDAVIVAIGEDFESSVLTIAHLQEIGIKRLIARTMNPVQERVVRLMGIKEQLLPERESAYQLAARLGAKPSVGPDCKDEASTTFSLQLPPSFESRSLLALNEELKQYQIVVTAKLEHPNISIDHIQYINSDENLKANQALLAFGKKDRALEAIARLS